MVVGVGVGVEWVGDGVMFIGGLLGVVVGCCWGVGVLGMGEDCIVGGGVG